jgi:signal transduction histidine kinase
MSAAPVTLAELRTVDLFDELDDAALEPWVASAEPLLAAPGEVVADAGMTPRGLLLLLEGTAQALIDEGSASQSVGRQVAPTWIGAIAVLTGGPMMARMQAESECRFAVVPAQVFRRLVFAQPAVHERVMRAVGPVMGRLSALESNRTRLAALGTMAAGLAHELNNPAAAARRAAADIAESIEVVGASMARFVESEIELADARQLVELQRTAAARAAAAGPLGALDAADAEEELLERLEALGVAEAWRIAEPLAAAGVDQQFLDRVAEHAGPATDAALRWIAAMVSAGRLATELQEATERMSGLVGAVKRYAYMDRGGMVEVDVHEGIETTLTVLGHKLKHTTIEVRRDYDRTLPKLTVHGPELNQVWTNLIDNALDALDGSGTIEIATRAEGGCAVVSITDDGPGIPEVLAARVFDPFFTTKDVGSGTGLGLATARQIVVDRHDGSIAVESEPGRTTFAVRLPFARR